MPTVLDALARSLAAAADYNPNDVVAPVAVLWPDGSGEWRRVAPLLAAHLPVLTLGDFDPERNTGPSVWIRAMLAGALETRLPEGQTPVVYLPGVSRAELRAVDECPDHLKPLAELQFRGAFFSQVSHRDWTLTAFLQSENGGLGIQVAGGQATLAALRNAAEVVVQEPVEAVRARAPLTAAYFNELLAPDLNRQMLKWLNDPESERKRMGTQVWKAFRHNCLQSLHFDPELDSALSAAERLGAAGDGWQAVWTRFRESPASYPALPDLLRRAKPAATGNLFDQVGECWPQDNESEENALRKGLTDIGGLMPSQLAHRLLELEQHHGPRREWVWAELGGCRLAQSLGYLVEALQLSQQAMPEGDLEAQARTYAESGYRVDLAVLRALACVQEGGDGVAVSSALQSIYRPWLESCCESFQNAWTAATHTQSPSACEPAEGRVYVFVDGLRMDAAQILIDILGSPTTDCKIDFRLAPVPTVTATAKPVAAGLTESLGPGPGFSPSAGGETPLSAERFRQLVSQRGMQVLSGDETGDPQGCAWTECGRVDEIGHLDGWRIAHRLQQELEPVCDRITQLLTAGWRDVRVVTDHGWLLLPGGLPTAHLPEPATELRKGRCARLKPDATVGALEQPWDWDRSVRIAIAPAITCFVSGKEYEHGGISPQECVLPEITVRPTVPAVSVSFENVKWAGLRCRVQTAGSCAGLLVDVRTKASDPTSSVTAGPKALDAEGSASLICADASREGEAAFVCVFAQASPASVILQQHTTIGWRGED